MISIQVTDPSNPHVTATYTWEEWLDLAVVLHEAGISGVPTDFPPEGLHLSESDTLLLRLAWSKALPDLVVEVYPDPTCAEGFRMEPHLPGSAKTVLVHPRQAAKARMSPTHENEYVPAPISQDKAVPQIPLRSARRYEEWGVKTTYILTHSSQLRVERSSHPF